MVIYATDRTGLLADIVKEIMNQKINIIGVNTKNNKDKVVTIEIELDIKNIQELNSLMKEIRKIESVYEVSRKK